MEEQNDNLKYLVCGGTVTPILRIGHIQTLTGGSRRIWFEPVEGGPSSCDVTDDEYKTRLIVTGLSQAIQSSQAQTTTAPATAGAAS